MQLVKSVNIIIDIPDIKKYAYANHTIHFFKPEDVFFIKKCKKNIIGPE